MRDQTFEQSSARFFDVPAHLYKQVALDTILWLRNSALFKLDEAFWYETRLRFFAGFFRERRGVRATTHKRSLMRGLAALFKAGRSHRKQLKRGKINNSVHLGGH
jgi:hypothetical protein